MQTTIASQRTSIQTSQNSVDQANAALTTQPATYTSTTAAPTQPDVDSANATVANAQIALQTAQNNLAAAV